MAEKVYLKSRDGQRWIRTSTDDARSLVESSEMVPSSEEEYQEHRTRVEQGGVVGTAKAAAEGVGAGFFDAALAVPKLATAGAQAVGAIEQDPLADITGRSTLAGARFLAEELMGGEGAVAEREYEEAARARARVNPLASGAGYLGGTIAGSGLTIGGAGALASRYGQAAGAIGLSLEGASQGIGAAQEEAWIQDHELTAEQLWGAVGLGAVLGGGIGIAPVLATKGVGKLRRVFGRTDDVSASTAAKTLPSAQAIDDAVSDALERQGVKPARGLGRKMRDALENAQVAVTGADADASAALRQYGAHRWDDAAVRGRDLYRNRARIVDYAARDIATAVDDMAKSSDEIINTAVDSGLRKEHIQRMLMPDGPITPSQRAAFVARNAEQVDAARDQFSRIIEVVNDTAPIKPPKGASVDDIAAHEAANELFGNLRARQQTAKYIDDLGRQLEGDITAADAYAVLDEAKRTLQKEHVALQRAARGAGRSGDRGGQIATQKLASYYESIQEPTRQFLESEELWGRLGKWQADKNAAFKKYIDTNRVFTESWLRQVGTDYNAMPVFRADPGKILSHLDSLGTAKNALGEEFVREHTRVGQELIEAISQGSSEFAEQLGNAKAQLKKVEELYSKADETVRTANQIKALIDKEDAGIGGTIGGAAWGGILGGVPGALIGGAASLIGKPGTALRQAAAIQELVNVVDGKTSGAVSRFLKKHLGDEPLTTGAEAVEQGAKASVETTKRVRAPWLTEAKRERAKQAMVPAAVNFAIDGKSEAESFRERSKEIRNISASQGTIVTQRISDGMSDLAGPAPKTYGALTGKALAGANYLQSILPAVSLDPELSRLGVVPPATEIAKWRDAWNAVANPLSVLDDLENGRVSPDAIEAVKNVYPRLFEKMRTEVMAQLLTLERPPPMSARVQLDLLLDMGGAIEPTVGAESLAMRATFAQEEAPAQPAPRGANISVAKQHQTLSQRIMSS